MRYQELFEVRVLATMLPPKLFHGSAKQYVNGILAHGIQPPDFEAFGTRNTSLRPVKGRVYFSQDANEAALYGSYMFVVNRETLSGDLQPDEDAVGEIYHWIMDKNYGNMSHYEDVHGQGKFVSLMRKLHDPVNNYEVRRFRNYMDHALTPNMKRNITRGEYIWWAKGGKAALRRMPEDLMLWLISLGVHVSHEGAVMPDEGWHIHSKGLLSDGSNLADVADRIPIDPAAFTQPVKRPPMKFLATFEYNRNWSGGEPIIKQKQQTITAPSEEEARGEAEIFMNNTVKDAAYRLVSLVPIT